jgi:hypothetical protein
MDPQDIDKAVNMAEASASTRSGKKAGIYMMR